MSATITTRDGRTVQLSGREAVIAELLVELRGDLARVEYGSIEFHVVGQHVTGHVTKSQKGRTVQMRAVS